MPGQPEDQRGPGPGTRTAEPAPGADPLGDTADDESFHELQGLARAVAIAGPPVTIATGLLFYFGWALTHEQARAMGVDESIFVMSTSDYVLRSVPALFLPLIAGAALLLMWLVTHGWLVGLAASRRTRTSVRRAGRVLAWSAWWALPAVGLVVAGVSPPWGELVLPLSIALGFLLAEYGARLSALAADPSAPRPSTPIRSRYLRAVLIGVLVSAALFWEVANYAGVVGRGKAALVSAEIRDYPAVTVYSRDSLHLEIVGVEHRRLAGRATDFRHAYTGLRLLQRSGDRFFLVPREWAPGRAPIVVLNDDRAVRLEFSG